MFGSIFGSVAGSVLGSVTSSLLGGGGGGGSSSGGSGFSMTDLIGPALQVGGSLIGGKLKNDSNEEINAHNLRLAQDQIEWQRQYAHNRLQWQVEDAKKAGLHPMVAAGLSPVSFSPVSADLTPNNYDWVGDIGQNLGYAAAKAKTNKQQQQAFDFQIKLGNEQLNGVRLDNELKVMQILGMVSQLRNSGPAAPSLGNSGNLINGQNDSFSNFGDSTVNLYSTARVGDILLTALNPDIADSLTESQLAHVSATLAREIESERNPQLFIDAFKHLKKSEQKAVLDGRALFEYVPGVGGYMLTYPRWTSKDKRSAGGKLRY